MTTRRRRTSTRTRSDTSTAAAARGFEAFVRELEPRVTGYLAYSLGSLAEAADVFQEVCLRLVRQWPSVREMDRPDSWVFRVAHNLSVSRHRRQRLERDTLESWRDDLAARRTPGHDADAADAPESDAVAAELAVAVQHALATLPDDQREAVCQRVWGGCTWGDIGDSLGVSPDTASRLFARGVRAIEPQLEGFRSLVTGT